VADPHDTWYVCSEPFVSADPDFAFIGRKGVTRLRGDDPAFRRFAKFFKPITSSDRSIPEIEEALAVPGRKRGG